MKKLLISSIIAISSLSLIAQDKVPLKGAHLSIKLESLLLVSKTKKATGVTPTSQPLPDLR
jgi:hypothetical protein